MDAERIVHRLAKTRDERFVHTRPESGRVQYGERLGAVDKLSTLSTEYGIIKVPESSKKQFGIIKPELFTRVDSIRNLPLGV